MSKQWSAAILALIGVVGTIGTLVGLPPASAWRLPLVAAFVVVVVVGVAAPLLSWLVRPAPWAVLPACKELGIDRIHAVGVGGSRMSRHLAEAGEIRVMAVSANPLLHHEKPHLLAALRNGATIKVLLAMPEALFVRDVEEVESDARVGNISKELSVVDGLLRELHEEAGLSSGGGRGRILVGRYSTHLRSSLVLCDRTWGWLTLNLPPKRAVHLCSLELRSGGLLDDATAHFDAVWAIAEGRGAVVEISTPRPSAQQARQPDARKLD